MPYIAIDLETTGLDVDNHQILEIGAVFNDFGKRVLACDVFRRTTHPGGDIIGGPFALAMNAPLLRQIAEGDSVNIYAACDEFRVWLQEHGVTHKNKATLLGKNIGSFDWQFLRLGVGFPTALINYRMLDVGSMYASPEGMSGQGDIIPGIEKKYEIPGTAHTAVHDARVSLALARQRWLDNGEMDSEQYSP